MDELNKDFSNVTQLIKKSQQKAIRGFSNKNLWRMKQFYETYKGSPNLSSLLREISWTHNLAIFSRCKTTVLGVLWHCKQKKVAKFIKTRMEFLLKQVLQNSIRF